PPGPTIGDISGAWVGRARMSSETFDLAWSAFGADYPNSAGGLQPRPTTRAESSRLVRTRRSRARHAIPVKLLAFSDLHRDRKRAERLVELASGADVVVGAGDYATMRIGLERTIETLSAITVPTVPVPGHAEPDTDLLRARA